MAVEVTTGWSTVLVTGRHPLLVPALVERLRGAGHRVLVPAPPLLPGSTVPRSWARDGTSGTAAPDVVEHDPEDPDVPAPLRRGVGLVLHLDPGPVGEDLATRSTAVLDSLFALRVAEVNRARLLVASVDGDGAHTGPLEGLVAGYRSAHDVDTVLARVTDCYGPGPAASATGVLTRMLASAVTTGTVVVDARDHRRHTPCFVDDAVDALLALAAHRDPARSDGDGGPVHVGPTTGLSTAELAEQVCRATGAHLRLVGLARPGDPAPVAFTSRPRRAATGASVGDRAPRGWQPRVDLPDGLRRCLATAGHGPVEPTVTGRVGAGQGWPEPDRGGLSRTGVVLRRPTPRRGASAAPDAVPADRIGTYPPDPGSPVRTDCRPGPAKPAPAGPRVPTVGT